MSLERNKADVFFIRLGGVMRDGRILPDRVFHLGKNQKMAEKRAARLREVWQSVGGPFWTEEALVDARAIERGEWDES